MPTRSSTPRCSCCFGRLAESRRRDTGFLLGVVLFTAASAACGAADSLGMLVAFRIVQAVGAALLTPTSLEPGAGHHPAGGTLRRGAGVDGDRRPGRGARTGRRRPARRRQLALGVPGQRPDRHRGGRRRLAPAARPSPGHPDPARCDRRRADHAGVAALTLGLVKGNDWGWGAAATVAVLAGAVDRAGAVRRCTAARAANPLVDGRLFAVRAFSGASVVALTFSIAFGAMLLSIVLWCQEVWGWSALQHRSRRRAGAADGPAVRASCVAGRLIARFGPGPVIGVGATVVRSRDHLVGAGRRASRPTTWARCSAACC